LPESAANLKREGVQVVEGVGLVTGFQFFTCLAAVFAEEVGNFFLHSNIFRSTNLLPLRPIEQEGPVLSILKIRFVVCGSKIINVVVKKSHVAPTGF